MKGLSGQSLNELVSLTVLALLAIALIAAQADATAPELTTAAAPAPAAALAARLERVTDDARIRADVAIDVDFETLAILFAIGDRAGRVRGEIEVPVRGGD